MKTVMFAGHKATVREVDRRVDNSKTNLLYAPGESLFGTFSRYAFANGFVVFPQQRTGKRLPSVIDGEVLKWGQWVDKAPERRELEKWQLQAPSANSALILSRSRGQWALDIDCNDADRAQYAIDCADKIFGRNQFRREGSAPRLVLLFKTGEDGWYPENRAFRFAGADGQASEDAIEVLGHAKVVTVDGIHHKTGRYFYWIGKKDLIHSKASELPSITEEQFKRFIALVNDRYPFLSTEITRSNHEFTELEPSIIVDGVRIPSMINANRTIGTNIVFIDGKVVDGRNDFLRMRCYSYANLNPTLLMNEDGFNSIILTIRAEVERVFANFNGWPLDRIQRVIKDDLRRIRDKIINGDLKAQKIFHGEAGEYVEQFGRIDKYTIDEDLDFIEPKKSLSFKALGITKADPDLAKDRALIEDRDAISKRVSSEVRAAINITLDEVYQRVEIEKSGLDLPEPKLSVLHAPTGSGKTSTLISQVSEYVKERGRLGKPIVLLQPTYENISESVARAGNMTVEQARKQLEASHVQERVQESIKNIVLEGEKSGLKIVVYRGMIKSGCHFPEIVEQLQKAQIATTNLCKASVREVLDDEAETKYCAYYDVCPYQAQKKAIKEADIVIAPSAYLTAKIPAELKDVAAIVVDERCWDQLARHTFAPLEMFDIPRSPPRLAKKDNDKPEDLMASRDYAAQIAKDAILAGIDPARAFIDYKYQYYAETRNGVAFVDDAIKVCSNNDQRSRSVQPQMKENILENLLSVPQARYLREERKFWQIVRDRVARIEDGTAYGKSDARLQTLTRGEEIWIRLSWRKEANWSDLPMLLLDASADEAIIAKVFGRLPEMRKIDAPLHLKAVVAVDGINSERSLDARRVEGLVSQERASDRTAKIRDIISSVSISYGNGRVIVGSSKNFRGIYNAVSSAPANVDLVHFGAIRGLDFAKTHAAAVSVGRMEIPTDIVDAIVGALTYDDPDPERPIDWNGTGLDDEGKELKPVMGISTLKMRDGRDFTFATPKYAEKSWARRVQIQYREEEIKQFIGRLRPVYRGGSAPVWVGLGSTVPEGIIIDRIVAHDDIIIGSANIGELARRTRGIICPDLAQLFMTDFCNIFTLQEDFKKFGFHEDANGFTRYSRGFTKIKIKTNKRNHLLAWIMTSIPDIRTSIEHMLRYIEHELVDFQILEVNQAEIPSQRRAPDKTMPIEATDPSKRITTEIDAVNANVHHLNLRMLDARKSSDVPVKGYSPKAKIYLYEGVSNVRYSPSTFNILSKLIDTDIKTLYPARSTPSSSADSEHNNYAGAD